MDNRRILIVDDNSDIHIDFDKILCPVLDTNYDLDNLRKKFLAGCPSHVSSLDDDQDEIIYAVDHAYSGLGAYEMSRKALEDGEPYALLFVDIRMPMGWDGIETSERILNDFPHTEIVICTAYSDYTWADFKKRFGETDHLIFLRKPFESLEVKQLANALTAKWNTAKICRQYVNSLESKVFDITKQLNEQQARLVQSEKMASLVTMSAGIAHEINTPLSVIAMTASLARDQNKDGEIDLYLETIHKTAAKIRDITQGLLKFSRRPDTEAFTAVTVKSTIDDTLNLCNQKFHVHGIQLILPTGNVSPTIRCQPMLMTEVLLNLLNNAFDAVQDGLREKWIKIAAEEFSDFIEISVTDSGSGIREDIRDKIFDPFFTTKDFGKGTGLGLSVSLGIVEKHGYGMFLDTKNQNTCFTIHIPKSTTQP